jgi:hypothetical protein
MPDKDDTPRKRAKEFARKVKNNEDASLILTIEEAQQIIWWWVYTEEFREEEDQSEILQNLRVEFKYQHSDEKDTKLAERIITHRIYNEKTSDLNDDRMWLPINADIFIQHISKNW